MKKPTPLPFDIPTYYQCPHCMGETFRISNLHHERLICTHCWKEEPITKSSYSFILSFLGDDDPFLVFQIPADVAKGAQLQNTQDKKKD